MKTVAAFIVAVLLLVSPAFAVDTKTSVNGPSYYIKELLALINHYRTSNRLKPLSLDNTLMSLARSHSAEMHRSGALNHDHFNERFKRSGRNSCVENVGWNYRTPKDLFVSWQKSEGHDKNMLAGDVRRAGISIVGTYVTFFACN